MTEIKRFSNELWSWQSFLIGGGSIAVCALMWSFTPKNADLFTIGTFAFALAFLINHPHFLSSYVLLYGDFRKKITQKFRYFWAAVIVPFALLCGFGAAFFGNRPDLLGHVVAFMFLTVGWHYVKQIFGCMIVSNARQNYFYSKWERWMILANLYSLWAISFLQSNIVKNQTYAFYGITYKSLELPPILFMEAQWVFGMSAIALVIMHVRKYVDTGRLPSALAVVSILALYAWYIPQAAHPAFAYLIPAFHSLQYLVFVSSFKKNKTSDEVKNLEAKDQRLGWLNKFLGFFVTAGILGALVFEVIPKFLDRQGFFPAGSGWSSEAFVAMFLLFINIHHYFIDNVMWRSDNDEIKKYLFASHPHETVQKQKSQASNLAS